MLKVDMKDLVKKEFLDSIRVIPYYQPIIDLSTMSIYGYEALSRFEVDGRRLHPLKVFEMAQEVGAVAELDLLCRRLAIENFPWEPGSRLFLNVYPSYLVSEHLGKGHTINHVLQLGLNPRNIVLELTEVERVRDTRLLKKAISHYRELGFGLGIDDIGTGFNSLEHLLNLEGLLEFVKLPRELVNGVSRSKIRHNLIKVLTEVSLSIGAMPVYEGLEKREDLMVLYQDFGAKLVQGFYFSPPLPPEELRYFRPEVDIREARYEVPVHGRALDTLAVEEGEKFGHFLEKVEECKDRFLLLNMKGASYILDLWKLKSQLNNHRKNLYYYRSLKDVVDLMDGVFVKLEEMPRIDLKRVNVKNLFDLVSSSEKEIFILERENGTNGSLKVAEKHELIDYLYRKLSRELLESNPLTQLPGNNAIEEKIRNLEGSDTDFYVCYLDIDNFKAFNDAYGFYAGDQMIKKVGFILKEFEEKHPDRVFVGHVGGDDFVVIIWNMSEEELKEELLSLLKRLKENLLEFYSQEDRKRGYFIAKGRDEELREFPLADVSMVLVRGSSDPLDVSRRSAQLKKRAKSYVGSALVIEGLNEILTIKQ